MNETKEFYNACLFLTRFRYYDVEEVKTLSILYTKFSKVESPGKFYNQEIKGNYFVITSDELVKFYQEDEKLSNVDRKTEILKKLQELEKQKSELLKELGEISYQELMN